MYLLLLTCNFNERFGVSIETIWHENAESKKGVFEKRSSHSSKDTVIFPFFARPQRRVSKDSKIAEVQKYQRSG